jgi:hypothetical protein
VDVSGNVGSTEDVFSSASPYKNVTGEFVIGESSKESSMSFLLHHGGRLRIQGFRFCIKINYQIITIIFRFCKRARLKRTQSLKSPYENQFSDFKRGLI